MRRLLSTDGVVALGAIAVLRGFLAVHDVLATLRQPAAALGTKLRQSAAGSQLFGVGPSSPVEALS